MIIGSKATLLFKLSVLLCVRKGRFGRFVIFLVPIQDGKLKFIQFNIPTIMEHNPYNKVTGCVFVCLSVCT